MDNDVSIHAPTRGATAIVLSFNPVSFRFNPRAHEGRDVALFRPRGIGHVSIHAPTRGATPCVVVVEAGWAFQSTRPRGARPLSVRQRKEEDCFNPRAHEGRDGFFVLSSFCHFLVSIHAPTRGATSRPKELRLFLCFNPRAHEGRDRATPSIPLPLSRFNPRAHEGRDSLQVQHVCL